MAVVELTCPHCGFSKALDESIFPPTGTKVTCPKCKGNFFHKATQAQSPPAHTAEFTHSAAPLANSPSLEASQNSPSRPSSSTPPIAARKQSKKESKKTSKKTMGFIIGAVLAVIHLCLVILAYLSTMKSHSSTAALVYVWFFFLDAPILLLLKPSAKLFGDIAPLIQFGVFGSGLWFFIPWLIDKTLTLISSNLTRTVRVVIIVGAIPLILSGFYRLSFKLTKLSIQQERPAALKKMLNSATSDFLTERVVFEEHYAPAGISSITRMNCRPGVGTEILLGLPRGVVFLNENYQEKYRLNLSDRKSFHSLEPLVQSGTQSCQYLAFKFQEDVYLLDSEGKEIWRTSQVGNTGSIDGVRAGDIDGDGRQEFAIIYKYREGIHLVDGEGKTRWKHPVYSLGHLEMADVRGNGKTEIIYSNSNNANGVTEFTILDAQGSEVNQQKINSASSEFAVIRWPNREANPNIMLTEEGKIRLVNLQGDTAMSLDAPGCKTYGAVRAITVKFKNEKSPFLVVRKSLHPDIFVLYVYDAEGKLVYQKTEVTDGGRAPTLLTVPANETGTEKLLVGGTTKDFKAQVSEYLLTR